MSICWFCHWGWPKPIADIYHEALIALNGDEHPLHYGPSHVVWEDENFGSAQGCLDDFEGNKGMGDLSEEELAVVKKSLERLLDVDEKYKDWPEEYDGENVEKFPPPEGWIMVDGAERRKWQMELQGIVGP